MNERAVFYQLTHKFVHNEKAIPEEARQVIYYSLAIGHHVGVMDCFQSLMEIPLDDYRAWISRLPEGNARHKLEGVLKWGEIEINCSHTSELIPSINARLDQMTDAEKGWSNILVHCMQKMIQEPALYMMVRKAA